MTAPSVAATMRLASLRLGKRFPRQIREIVDGVALTIFAKSDCAIRRSAKNVAKFVIATIIAAILPRRQYA